MQREARQAAQAQVDAIPLEELERMVLAEKARRERTSHVATGTAE
jgi:type II secretory pathway component PulK